MAAKEQQNPETKNPVMPEVEKARLADGDSFWKSRNNLLFLLAILSITFGVYLPVYKTALLTGMMVSIFTLIP